MTRIQKRIMYFGVVIVMLCALSVVMVPAAPEAPAEPKPSEVKVHKALARIRELAENDRWAGLIEEFENEDFSAWPEAAEGFYLRGMAYLNQKDGAKAERDLKEAVKRDPTESFFWYGLAETCHQLLKDDKRALEAYKKAFELENNLGWMPAAAAVKSVNILLYDLKNEEALQLLQRYSDEDLEKIGDYWRFNLLRAYARVYAAMGQEEEARVKFMAALVVESRV